MDIKDPKLHKIGVAILVLVVLILFWHSRFYSKNQTELTTKQNLYEKILTELNQVKLKAKSLKGLQEEYDLLLWRYDKIGQLLPDEKQVAKFLMQMHSASARTQSRILEITPQSVRAKDFYNICDYEIKFTGTYHEFGEFLAGVANFPFITNVSNIIITGIAPTKLEKANEKTQFDVTTLEASFVLSTYFVKANETVAGIQP